jgi:hypothetical protein
MSSSTLHLVDPELVAPLETFPVFVLTNELLPLLREGQKQMMAAMPKPENPGVKIEARKIPGLEGPEVGVMIYTPARCRPCCICTAAVICSAMPR